MKLTKDKREMYELVLNLLGSRVPSLSYPVFLWEIFYLFQLKAICDNRTYKGISNRILLNVFHSSNFDEQSLFCELFLHNIFVEHPSLQMIVIFYLFCGILIFAILHIIYVEPSLLASCLDTI